MKKIKLSKESRKILQAMTKNLYPDKVPDDEILEFKLLRQIGFVQGADVMSGDILAPRLTERGQAYIHQNPRFKNPSIFDDSKYIITTSISILALIVAFIALLK